MTVTDGTTSAGKSGRAVAAPWRTPARERMRVIAAERRRARRAALQAAGAGAHLQARARAAHPRAEAAVQAAQDEFLAAASHELRTPMTSLRGYVQFALRQLDKPHGPDPEKFRRALRVIDQQSALLMRLVDQLLGASRLRVGGLVLARERTDLGALVGQAVARARATIRHPLVLLSPAPVWASVDAACVEQVVLALVENAVRYSIDDTPVEIEVTQPSPETGQVTVWDGGLAVLPEHRGRFFAARYGSGERRTGGMGLGLYLSRQIVALHGGRIEVDSPPRGGTRITVTLPVGVGEE